MLSQASAVEIRLERQPETPEAMAHLVAMLLQVPASVKQRLLSISALPALLRDEARLLRGKAAGLTIALRGVDIVERVATKVHGAGLAQVLCRSRAGHTACARPRTAFLGGGVSGFDFSVGYV